MSDEELIQLARARYESGLAPSYEQTEAIFRAMDERDVAHNVLRKLEWSAHYSYCTGWPCCPICKGIKPGYGADTRGDFPDNSGHTDKCQLAKCIGATTRAAKC